MVLEEIKERRSVRSYQKKEIPKEILLQVLEAVRLAPSAGNRQHWKFVVVQDEDLKKQIMLAADGEIFIGEASAVIAGCATSIKHIMPNGVPSYSIDVAIALDHLSLQAVKLGLSTCWIGSFKQDRVREILGVPDSSKIVSLMTLGYSAEKEKVSAKNRKSLTEIISYDYYQD